MTDGLFLTSTLPYANPEIHAMRSFKVKYFILTNDMRTNLVSNGPIPSKKTCIKSITLFPIQFVQHTVTSDSEKACRCGISPNFLKPKQLSLFAVQCKLNRIRFNGIEYGFLDRFSILVKRCFVSWRAVVKLQRPDECG